MRKSTVMHVWRFNITHAFFQGIGWSFMGFHQGDKWTFCSGSILLYSNVHMCVTTRRELSSGIKSCYLACDGDKLMFLLPAEGGESCRTCTGKSHNRHWAWKPDNCGFRHISMESGYFGNDPIKWWLMSVGRWSVSWRHVLPEERTIDESLKLLNQLHLFPWWVDETGNPLVIHSSLWGVPDHTGGTTWLKDFYFIRTETWQAELTLQSLVAVRSYFRDVQNT